MPSIRLFSTPFPSISHNCSFPSRSLHDRLKYDVVKKNIYVCVCVYIYMYIYIFIHTPKIKTGKADIHTVNTNL